MHLHTFLSSYFRLKHKRFSFQHFCLLCHNSTSERVCEDCVCDFFIPSRYRCHRCALPLITDAMLCGECFASKPEFDTTLAAYIYQGQLRELLIRFKAKKDFVAGAALADLFNRYIEAQRQYLLGEQAPDVIIPIPLHWRRRWQRGFNQSLWFARHISRILDIPCHAGILLKQRYIDPQKQLKRQQRLRLPDHTFTTSANLNGQHIAIVDDVMTTGATANAAASVLKQAGATKVNLWVLARTPKTKLS